MIGMSSTALEFDIMGHMYLRSLLCQCFFLRQGVDVVYSYMGQRKTILLFLRYIIAYEYFTMTGNLMINIFDFSSAIIYYPEYHIMLDMLPPVLQGV